MSLERILTFKDLTMIVIGTVIGSGIFIVPAAVLRQTGGDVNLALLVWVAGGAVSLLGALSYAELGAMFPHAGGLYVYLRDAFGPFVAFLYGWSLFCVIGSGAVATLAVAFASYVQQFIPINGLGARAVSVAMVVAVAAINVRGVRQSSNVQNWTTAMKVGAILLMSGVLVAMGRASWSDGPLVPSDAEPLGLLAGIGMAMVGVLWAYEGWHYVSFSAGETVDPQRTFARAITIGTAALIGIYLIANVAYVASMGPARAAQSDRIAADAVSSILGPEAAGVIAAAILVSMFSAANGITLTATRVYYAMAHDGLFFRRFGDIHPRLRTPAVAVVWSSAWAILFAVTGTFEQLFTYVVFAGWIFYALAASSVVVFRRTLASRERPFRVPGYPVTPLLFIAASLTIVVNTLISQPERGLVGLSVLLLGVPAYAVWSRRKVKSER